MTIGQRIKTAIQESGVSRKHLAEKLECSRTAINYWENDKAQISAVLLFKLAEIVGCDPSWIMTGNSNTPRTIIDKQRMKDAIEITTEGARAQPEGISPKVMASIIMAVYEKSLAGDITKERLREDTDTIIQFSKFS